MPEAVIVSAVRTPVGRHGGVLKDVRPDDLAALVLKEAAARATLDPALIDEVYMGCANQAGEDNRNVARMAVLLAGFPVSVPGVTLNRLCASGLAAVNAAARAIKAGDAEVCIAGGVESMTRSPYAIPKTHPEWAFGNVTAFDTTIGWRFVNPRMKELHGIDSMGETAENVRESEEGLGITREAQDAFALESHRRAVAAIESGKFAEEIIPVPVPQSGRREAPKLDEVQRRASPAQAQLAPVPQRKGDPILVSRDEHPRADTSMEALGKLKPAFRAGGSVTAGNSSGINDGAAALVLMSDRKAQTLGLKPLARIISGASAGVEPRTMGLGPIPATRKALKLAGLTIEDIRLIELNEAFAVQALAVMGELNFRHEITNVNGGAIALGHPLGCSGARLMCTLVHEMRRRAATEPRPYYGLVTLCVGVGQGETAVVEWIGN